MSEVLNFPVGWTVAKVHELAELLRGINYKKEQASNYPKLDYKPILRATNIQGSLNFDELVFVPMQNISEKQLIKAGDVIFAMSSGSKHLVGKSAQSKFDFDGLIEPEEQTDSKCGAYGGLYFLYRRIPDQ